MYEKDGEKYFIVDEHSTSGTPGRENWVEGRENLAKGWIDCFYGYHQLGPPETHWDMEKYLRWTARGLRAGRVRRGPRRQRRSSSRPTSSTGTTRASTPSSATGGSPTTYPGKFIVNGRWDPREGEAGSSQLEEDAQEVEPQGRQALHRRVARATRAAGKMDEPEAYRFLEKCQELGIKNIHAAQGPDDLAAGQGRVQPRGRRPRRHRLPGAELHRRARGHAADRGLLLHRGAGAQRVRGPVGRDRRPTCTPGRSSSRRSWASCCSGSVKTAGLRQRLQHLGRRSGRSRASSTGRCRTTRRSPTTRKLTTATKKKIIGLNAAKLYDIEVPAEYQLPAPGTTADEEKAPGEELLIDAGTQARVPRHEWCPSGRRLGVRWTRCSTPSSTSRSPIARVRQVVHRVRGRGGDRPAAAAHLLLRAELLLAHGRRRATTRCRRCRG